MRGFLPPEDESLESFDEDDEDEPFDEDEEDV